LPYNNALVSENFWKLFFQNPENPHKHWVFWHFQKVCPYLTQADDLGRVVIPKEIRRTLRIREGDPLEIFTQSDGEVIFKKYSPIGELGPYTKQYVDVLSRTSGMTVAICDRDRVVAVAGMPKKDVVGKRISPMLESYMEKRSPFVFGTSKDELVISEDVPAKISVMNPIIGGGDVMGAIALLSDSKGAAPSQTDIKLTQVAAGFLSKQMEE